MDVHPHARNCNRLDAAVNCRRARPSTQPTRDPARIVLLRYYYIEPVFKTPTSVNLTHRGFDVTFSTRLIAWTNVSVTADAAADEEGGREFEIIPGQEYATLHR